ncbi:MAG: protein translocase subunit SecD [Chloroflexi bacterium]|nr:protein translocase subunit SecD [Chloroflexota bacterium]
MRSRNIYLLIFILALFGFTLWSIVPLDRNVFGRENLRYGLDLKGGSYLVYQADLTQIEPGTEKEIMDGVKGVIERRINALGITESTVQIQKHGEGYNIVIQIPGIADIEKAKEMVGLFAVLEFREQDAEGNWIPATGTVNGQELILSSQYFKENTSVGFDPWTSEPLLLFEWDETGAQLSKQITTRLLGKQLAIFLGDNLITAPRVDSVIEDRGQIEGLSLVEAQELSRLLNAGRIKVPLGKWVDGEFQPNVPLYERTVDATLGQDSIQKSRLAAEIGIALLVIFMLAYYRLPGLVACLALGIYGVILLAIFKLIPITLTLPGVAGFVVSFGMAVDANVLIFERMKEELRAGRSLAAAVEAGFTRAWTAIRDSNITTFIACFILIWLGGELGALMVRGFAITLLLGVALSMFTAITVTRTFLRLIVGSQVVTNPAAYGVPLSTVRNTHNDRLCW